MAVKRCPMHGEWKSCPERVEAELAELAALGFSCGLSGGACNLRLD
jgi:hypothetical protein